MGQRADAAPARLNCDGGCTMNRHQTHDGDGGVRRRTLLAAGGSMVAGIAATDVAAQQMPTASSSSQAGTPVALRVNGQTRRVVLDPRTTLLDALREHLGLPGTKKGCDHGQCGACTVHIDGMRVLSCLTLAMAVRGEVTTIEGLAGQDGDMHPMQQAFSDHDAFQCGYCTPGQIMS